MKHENVINLVEIIIDDEKEKWYLFMDFCVVVLQDLLDKAPNNRFPVWQSHWSVDSLYLCVCVSVDSGEPVINVF